jgi:hypothetical protein
MTWRTPGELGDAESSLGDAKSSLGDAKSSLGDAESSLGDAKSSLVDAESSLGDAESSLGDVCHRPLPKPVGLFDNVCNNRTAWYRNVSQVGEVIYGTEYSRPGVPKWDRYTPTDQFTPNPRYTSTKVRMPFHPGAVDTMALLRIGRLGFGTGRQRMVLERGTTALTVHGIVANRTIRVWHRATENGP